MLGLVTLMRCGDTAVSLNPLFDARRNLTPDSSLVGSWIGENGGFATQVWTFWGDSGTYFLGITDSARAKPLQDPLTQAFIIEDSARLARLKWDADALSHRAERFRQAMSALAPDSFGTHFFVGLLGQVGRFRYLDLSPSLGGGGGTATVSPAGNRGDRSVRLGPRPLVLASVTTG